MNNGQKGTVTVYNKNTDHQTRIKPELLEEYKLNGYIRGCRPFTEEHKLKIGKANSGNISPFKGTPRSKEICKKISDSKKGVKHSKERCAINSRCHKGLHWYNNGIEETQSKTCPDGWESGRLRMTEEQKLKLSKSHKGKKLTKAKLEIRASKEYLTKKKNNSFNTSKPEEKLYEELLKENVNKTIFRRYKEERYPFYCDFYILEDDLFIELNAHWTHGGMPFDPNSKECQEKLAIWEEKAKTSQFYENAIKTWTIRDVEKQNVAKENNLNYKVIY